MPSWPSGAHGCIEKISGDPTHKLQWDKRGDTWGNHAMTGCQWGDKWGNHLVRGRGLETKRARKNMFFGENHTHSYVHSTREMLWAIGMYIYIYI